MPGVWCPVISVDIPEKTTYDVLERESPINYVQNVRTPLIMFHGENDLRTGLVSGEQFYKSLKLMGRPVEYVRHPRCHSRDYTQWK